jgi:[acyl-carrier-protein] S-malonyltransferase
MEPAARRLEETLNNISIGSFLCPVISNVEASPYADQHRVKALLVEQVCAPVRWDESVLKMQELGVSTYVEIGPGKVLSGLVKRISKESSVLNINDVDSLNKL